MRTYLKLGAVGSVIALALSATTVFAEGRPANVGQGGFAQRGGSQYQSDGAMATGTRKQSAKMSGYGRRPADIGSTTPRGMRATGESYAAQREARAAQMRAKAQERLAAVQDKAKQQLVEHLSGAFDRINKTWTNHFSRLLDRYDAILQKIQDRARVAGERGKSVTAANAAIEAAHTAITSARGAVAVQAARTYVPDLSSASTTTVIATSTPSGQKQIMQGFRTAFQTLRDELFGDLFALRDGQMKEVRTAMQAAFHALSRIPGVDERSATSTASSATSTNQ